LRKKGGLGPPFLKIAVRRKSAGVFRPPMKMPAPLPPLRAQRIGRFACSAHRRRHRNDTGPDRAPLSVGMRIGPRHPGLADSIPRSSTWRSWPKWCRSQPTIFAPRLSRHAPLRSRHKFHSSPGMPGPNRGVAVREFSFATPSANFRSARNRPAAAKEKAATECGGTACDCATASAVTLQLPIHIVAERRATVPRKGVLDLAIWARRSFRPCRLQLHSAISIAAGCQSMRMCPGWPATRLSQRRTAGNPVRS
jgi:hypothetical protein